MLTIEYKTQRVHVTLLAVGQLRRNVNAVFHCFIAIADVSEIQTQAEVTDFEHQPARAVAMHEKVAQAKSR